MAGADAAAQQNAPMTPAEDPHPAAPSNGALPLLLVAVTLAFGWILLPFYGAILWGSIIAILFTPVYRWLLPRLNRRRTPAALLTLLLVLVLVVIPFAFVSTSLASQALAAYQRLLTGEWNPVLYFSAAFDARPAWADWLLDHFGLADFADLQRRLSEMLVRGSQFIATQALSIGLGTFDFVARVFIALYLAFFLIRDGEGVVRSILRAVPLAGAQKRQLLDTFGAVIRATVKGNLLVAAIQGALGGVAFWFVGVGGPMLWAVLMAFLSLLPAVGASLVWGPVALWFLLTGGVWQGVALVAWGVLVIGLIDNLLRPVLVGRDTGMPDYLVLITTLGGMAAFGLSGFVLGPGIAAMFIAVWHLHTAEHDDAA